MTAAHKIAWNTGLAFALNVALRAPGTLAFIAIGWLDSASNAGLFSLALGYLAILTTLFIGLDDILVRESARARQQTPPIFLTYGAIRLAVSLVVWLALLLILRLLSLYSSTDLAVLTVMTSCIWIDAFSALGQSILNAHDRFGWPLVATVAGSLVKLGGALIALQRRWDLLAVALAWPLGSALTAVILVLALVDHLRRLQDRAVFRFDRDLARRFAQAMPAFSATSLLAGLEYQLDVVLLSVLLSSEAVAWYSAAVTIMMLVLMVSQAYRVVLYPVLVQALAHRPSALRGLVGRSLLIMGAVALPAAGVIALLAHWLVDVLFGSRFGPAGPVLQVLIWNSVLFFLNVPLVRFMLATNGQGAVWRTLAVTLTVNLVVNSLLIPRVGVIGPAYARLLSSGLFCSLMGWQVFRRLSGPTLATPNGGAS